MCILSLAAPSWRKWEHGRQVETECTTQYLCSRMQDRVKCSGVVESGGAVFCHATLGGAEDLDVSHGIAERVQDGAGSVDRALRQMMLNWLVRYVTRDSDVRMAMELEPDRRHVDGIGSDRPQRQRSSDTRSKAIRRPGHRRSGISAATARGCSGTMRLPYRAKFARTCRKPPKCLAQRMQDSIEFDVGELRRVAVLEESPKGCVDAVWYCIKNSSTVQRPIGLLSGDNEFYACTRRGASLLGTRAWTWALL